MKRGAKRHDTLQVAKQAVIDALLALPNEAFESWARGVVANATPWPGLMLMPGRSREAVANLRAEALAFLEDL